jgi:ribosome-associated translation inhibitor RaiA
MKVQLRLRGLESEGLTRRIVERKVRFALGRFQPRIAEVRAEVSDMNAGRGGIDKHCRITAKTEQGHELIGEAVDATIEVAVDRASERVSRSISRHLGRQRDFARASIRTADIS